jgi:hypothetical protein
MSDPFGAIAEAEAAIAAKARTRDATQIEFRSVIALETIADALERGGKNASISLCHLRWSISEVAMQPPKEKPGSFTGLAQLQTAAWASFSEKGLSNGFKGQKLQS